MSGDAVRRQPPESMKGRYSPAECIGACKERIEGDPDWNHVSTSYAAREDQALPAESATATISTASGRRRPRQHDAWRSYSSATAH